MILIEHEGVEYALVTHGKEKSWVNARNRKASEDVSDALHEKASLMGFSKEQPNPIKKAVVAPVKRRPRRIKRKNGGIAIKVDLKNRS